MSQTETPTPAPKKKKSGKKKLLLILLTLIVVGGGGTAGGLYAMGQLPLGGGGQAEEEEAHLPELVVRDGVSDHAAVAARARARRGSPDPRVFESTYVPIEQPFTSNLRGGEAFVQIGIGVSTYYGEEVVHNLETHQMAVRSAILMTLSEQDPAAITTLQGKQALKLALKNAINEALTIREGFGGIDDVYFTSFVTQ